MAWQGLGWESVQPCPLLRPPSYVLCPMPYPILHSTTTTTKSTRRSAVNEDFGDIPSSNENSDFPQANISRSILLFLCVCLPSLSSSFVLPFNLVNLNLKRDPSASLVCHLTNLNQQPALSRSPPIPLILYCIFYSL